MARRELDMREVIDELAALEGKDIRVEVHALGSGPAPRAELVGRAGVVGMAQEDEADERRGLVHLSIGDRGSCIYFGEEYFHWADVLPGRLTIVLRDQTLFVITG